MRGGARLASLCVRWEEVAGANLLSRWVRLRVQTSRDTGDAIAPRAAVRVKSCSGEPGLHFLCVRCGEVAGANLLSRVAKLRGQTSPPGFCRGGDVPKAVKARARESDARGTWTGITLRSASVRGGPDEDPGVILSGAWEQRSEPSG